jgi:hypothetical protein
MADLALNGDGQLEYTQELRRRLINGLMPEAVELKAADPKILNVLLNAMKDHDKVTLTLKRIDADTENADADRQALAQFHRLSEMTGSKDLLKQEGGREGPPAFDPSEIPSVELVEGETHRESDTVDFDHFITEQREKRRQKAA